MAFSSFGDTYAVSNHIAFKSLTEKQLQEIQTDFTQILMKSDSGIRLKQASLENSKTEWVIFREQCVGKNKSSGKNWEPM